MVATSQPLAAQVGLDILKPGGNAGDAAIATNAMMGLIEPMSCGIGGDLFAIVWDAKTQKLYGLNASGRAPMPCNTRSLSQTRASPRFPKRAFSRGRCPAASTAGTSCAAVRHDVASSSFWPRRSVMPKRAFRSPRSSPVSGRPGERARRNMPTRSRRSFRNGRAAGIGEMFRNPYLAASLRAHRQGGPRRLLPRARSPSRSSRFQQVAGGLFSMKDFDDHTSTWVEPVSTNYRGYDVWELPPNGQGIAALEILNILEGYDLRAMGRNSPDYLAPVHRGEEAGLCRPGQVSMPTRTSHKLPVAELISKDYAARQRKRIDLTSCGDFGRSGRPAVGQEGDTIYLCVVDKDRNCCSLIQSNYCGLRLRRRARARRGLRDAKPRLAVRPGPQAPQLARAAQTALPHDHPRDGDEGRQAVARASA